MEARTGNLAGNRDTLTEHAAIHLGRSKIELTMARDVKDIKKGFYEYVGDKGKRKDNVVLFLMRLDMEKFEFINTAFVSVYTAIIVLQKSTILDTREKV